MARTTCLALACVLGSVAAVAQQPNSEPLPGAPSTAQAVAPETPISLRQCATNVLRDQKPVWTFPAKVVRGEHWKPVLSVAVVAAALVALDPYTDPYFHNHSGFSTYKTVPLRGRNTALAITLTPAAFYLAGLAKHSPHARNTGLLAAEGIADAQIVTFVMKHAAGRLTPSDIPPEGSLRDTWFKYKGSFSNGGSFPSGHAASAFAVATVICGPISDASLDSLDRLWGCHSDFANPPARPGALPFRHFRGRGFGVQHQPFCCVNTVKRFSPPLRHASEGRQASRSSPGSCPHRPLLALPEGSRRSRSPRG